MKKTQISEEEEAEPLSPTDKVFKRKFEEIDTYKNGSLSKKEFKDFMKLSQNPRQIEIIFDIIDTNHDGSISIDEFIKYGRALIAISKDKNYEPYLKMIFDSVDTNKTGYLSISQFARFLILSGNKLSLQGREHFSSWDMDQDGKLSFEDVMNRVNLNIKMLKEIEDKENEEKIKKEELKNLKTRLKKK